LKVASDVAWVEGAMRDLDAILVDHAHCEMKAATNALSLVTRHGALGPEFGAGAMGEFALIRALTELAHEEIDHFQRAVDFLEKRGLRLGVPPVDAYAAELRRVVNALPRAPRMSSLVDRLLVAALIEARSCERFKLLLGAMSRETHGDLAAFYDELFTVEARHYQVCVELAVLAANGDRAGVEQRLELAAEREADIVRALARGDARATVHG
jgi:tRNA 2-(methylsulfanyl)-N6-isopentenyladenosine37 hydroxylase